MKVFLSGNIAPVALKQLEENNISITQWKEDRQITAAELIEACKEHDALISIGPNKIDAPFLETCSHLKVIALHSVGFDQVDVETAKRLNIPVGNTPGVLSAATAETAFLLMLAVSRKAFFYYRKITEGKWDKYEPSPELGIEVSGKTLGVFGLGKIGLEMAKKCKGAFNMNVIYHNRSRNEEAEKEVDAQYVSFETLLAQSDVLSVHTALTDETKGQFDYDVFKQMKPNSIFINTARGGIHNEEDLKKALDEKLIWGAGLDVTNPEPMDKDNPLLDMENVAILPHIGSATEETRAAMAKLIVENIVAGLKGEKLPYPIY